MPTKKEIKEQYKRMKFPMGVFQIRNIVNGKIFISSSMNLDAIWNRHKFQLTMGGHANKGLQDDWKKFGEENFAFEILEILKESEDPAIDDKKEVEILEEMIIEKLQPFEEKGYNKKKS